MKIGHGLVLFSMLMALSLGVAFAGEEIASTEAAVNETLEANETIDANETMDANETIAVEITDVGYEEPQFVEIANSGEEAEDLANWTLEVNDTIVYTFPEFTLNATEVVTVFSEMGNDTATELYANATLFTEADEEVYLLDADGLIVSEFPAEEEEEA